ncbi:cytochrome c [Halovulum dunhuangense]|uniref:Cytochrome c n=1 Tax=Halovulum dunhuangense TaxID=1505036 RepID=A0A849L6N7_9RHOB|nr:cytochrome c [Halovulum dunhuangense]NNU81737.1 cytochrome c [Halovulum dunhuangense]
MKPMIPGLTAAALMLAAGTGAAQDGAALYMEHCAACHGASLEGQPDWQSRGPDGRFPAPPHDASGHTWHHGDGMLIDYITRGGQAVLDDMGVAFASGMPGFGEVLGQDEIVAILDHIKESWPEAIRRVQEARTAAEAGN